MNTAPRHVVLKRRTGESLVIVTPAGPIHITVLAGWRLQIELPWGCEVVRTEKASA